MQQPTYMKEILAACDRIADAKVNLAGVIRRTFPKGTPVLWMHKGIYRQHGIVSGSSMFDFKVSVINSKTGREVKLDVGSLSRAEKDPTPP